MRVAIAIRRAAWAAGLCFISFGAFASTEPAPDPCATQADRGKDTLDLGRWWGKVVLLDFWASWCVPCRASFPWMNTMVDELGGDGLVVVAVNVDDKREAAEAFLADQPRRFEIVYDPAGCLPERFGVAAMPTSFVIDRKGRIAFRHTGFLAEEREQYETHIKSVLSGEVVGVGTIADLAGTSKEPGLGVHPWERSVLARKEMKLDADALDLALDDHIYFSKEASSGGRGFGGGGCGCN